MLNLVTGKIQSSNEYQLQYEALQEVWFTIRKLALIVMVRAAKFEFA